MQAQTTLVGSDGAVELHTVATIDLDLARVIHPRHAEDDDALGLDETLEEASRLVLGMGIQGRLEGCEDLLGSLNELGLVCVALLKPSDDSLGIVHWISSRNAFSERVIRG